MDAFWMFSAKAGHDAALAIETGACAAREVAAEKLRGVHLSATVAQHFHEDGDAAVFKRAIYDNAVGIYVSHDNSPFRGDCITGMTERQERGEALDISAYKYCRACRYCSSHIQNGSSDLATCEYMAHTGQSRIAACAKLGTSGKVGKGCPCFVPYHPEKDKNANWRKPIALPGSLPRKTQKQDMTAKKRIDHDEALRMHRDGKTDRQIAKHFGVSHSAVWQWRQRQGLPLNRESNEYRARFDRGEALRLYQLGLSDRAIAKPLGVTARAIYKWRKRQGMPANHQYRKGGGEENVGKGSQGGGRDAGGAGRRDG